MKIAITVIILIIILSFVFGGFRPFFASLKFFARPKTYKYLFSDIYHYFKEKKWRIFNQTGIVMYGGLFGTGKTLQMVTLAEKIYRNYDNVKIYSNVTLNHVPYEPFLYLEQLTDSVPEGEVAVYICDEFGSLFNSRNYQNCEMTDRKYLTILNQIRKENKLLIISTQRYGMVDKVFRQVCREWRESKRFWRFFMYYPYDPYELEYTLNPLMVRPLSFFPRVMFADKHVYSSYNTKERVLGFGQSNVNYTPSTDTTVNTDYADRQKFIRKKYRK